MLIETPASARITLLTNSTNSAAPSVAPSTAAAQPAKNRLESVAPAEQARTATQAAAAKSIARSKAIGVDDHTKLSPRGTPFVFPSWHLMLIAGWLAGALIALARLAAVWLSLQRSLRAPRRSTTHSSRPMRPRLRSRRGIGTPRLGALDELASPIAVARPHPAAELGGRAAGSRTVARDARARNRAHRASRSGMEARDRGVVRVVLVRAAGAARSSQALTKSRKSPAMRGRRSISATAARLPNASPNVPSVGIGGVDIALAPAMAGRESPLLRRIDYLIAGVPMNTSSAGMRAGIAVVAALAIGAFVLPGVSLHSAAAQSAPPIPPAPPIPSAPPPPAAPAVPPARRSAAPAQGHHVHISSDISINGQRDLTIVQVNDSQHNYSVKIDGKVEFNDTEDDIATSLRRRHRDIFRNATRQDAARRDRESRRQARAPLFRRRQGAAARRQRARKWMAALIPSVIRETAIDAEGRVKRIRAKGGVDAVLDEIAHIDSGYARGVYLRALAGSGKLTSAQMTRALELVDAIDSDYEKRNALAALAAVQPLDAASRSSCSHRPPRSAPTTSEPNSSSASCRSSRRRTTCARRGSRPHPASVPIMSIGARCRRCSIPVMRTRRR